ncbi:MAG TPA: DUF370 domain-containing protein [Clostridia bacterium]|nr:DUF370 domain-containing protein [Clostridia bacterium]HRX41759.1 DUF370 domain-containing protein [Clostridia bacterium]
MYLHIGGNHVIDRRDIIGVFDIEKSTISNITRDYLRKQEREGRVITIVNDMPKSFIVVMKENNTFVYLSSISPVTLKKRFEGNEDSYNGVEER